MAAGKKTGGRVAGTPNKRKRQAVVAEAIARVGETIPDAFAGDAHALLIATYKNPNLDLHVRLDAAKAALPYEKPRLQTVTLANEGGEPLKVRSELEIGRRLMFVLEMTSRKEIKVKMPSADQAHVGAQPPSSSRKQGSDLKLETDGSPPSS
jgi:hypothetical protein